MHRIILSIVISLFLAAPLAAQGITKYSFEGSFADATFALENEIIGKGLGVDFVAHSGEMLARTGADLGSDVKLFDAADVYLFCSAVLSRRVMEVNPDNIAFCPYGIFIADRNGEVSIGYRNFPEGEMQEIQALLDEIARAAADQ